MQDKEVGELWRDWKDVASHDELGQVIKNLIRKLIQERQRRYSRRKQPWLSACASFGIDPATLPSGIPAEYKED